MKETNDKIRTLNNKKLDSIENNDEKTDEKNVVSLAGKNKSTARRFTIGSLVLFAFMLFYIPSLLNWLSGNNIAKDIIRNGILENSVNADAIIIRDEELLKPPVFGGRIVADIGEGEKTPAFKRIAIILNKESTGLLQEIEEINKKIVKARLEKAEKADFYSEDLVKLDKDIGLKVQDLIFACNSRNFKDLSKYRSEIGKIVEKKAEIVGESSTDNYINQLKKQKDTIQKRLNNNTAEISSDISGIVSYAVDGYETELTPAKIRDITPEKIENILEAYTYSEGTDRKATTGGPPAKIIKGTDIYLAAEFNTSKVKDLKTGQNIKLRVNDANIETTAVIANISKPEAGKTVVTIKTGRGSDVLSAVRKVNVDFIRNKEEGLKVPVRCLRNFSKDGRQADIMLIKANVAYYIIVDIIFRDEEYAIIKTAEADENKYSVNLYDTYIINPDNIKEGEIIEK